MYNRYPEPDILSWVDFFIFDRPVWARSSPRGRTRWAAFRLFAEAPDRFSGGSTFPDRVRDRKKKERVRVNACSTPAPFSIPAGRRCRGAM